MVCMLDIPVTKTSTAFTKPIDPVVGEAIDAWQRVRPPQPRFVDPRTGETVDMLFALRARRVSEKYINRVLIPMLCRKANVPAADARGPITSHRARATIATSLYNAKDPMTLFELQAWLGHSSPQSTQRYARISPITLTKAYTDAGYFARNLRTIEVLIDRDAVRNGTAATGTPWEFFDLGQGWCTYLQLLRAMPPSHGLRPLRLLHPETIHRRAAPRSKHEPDTHARRDPPHRRRTSRRRGRPDRNDSATRTPRRHTHPGRAHATHPREPRPPSRHHDADHQPRQRPAAMPAREPLRQRLSPESACYL